MLNFRRVWITKIYPKISFIPANLKLDGQKLRLSFYFACRFLSGVMEI
jgi:hypothetical protein